MPIFHLAMDTQTRIQKLIRQRFEASRAKNPSLSLRAFCKRYGLKPAVVSLILLGKRRAGPRSIQALFQALNPDPQTRSEILASLSRPATNSEESGTQAPDYVQISADQYKVISDWYYMAIIYLTRVKGFRSDMSWIATRIGIPVKTAQLAVDRLLKLGYLRESDGQWTPAEPYLRTTDDVQNAALRRSHDEILDLARDALHNEPLDRRDMTWIVFPMNSKKMDRAKELIREFQDRMLTEMESDSEPDEVYRLAVNFFPHTKKGKSK